MKIRSLLITAGLAICSLLQAAEMPPQAPTSSYYPEEAATRLYYPENEESAETPQASTASYYLEKVAQLLQSNNPNAQFDESPHKSILMYFVYPDMQPWDEENKETKDLISKGADLNLTDDNGNTALFYAIAAGNLSAVKLLLDQNAQINHVNKQGFNALAYALDQMKPNNPTKREDWAQQSFKSNIKEIVQLLIARGLNINSQTSPMVGQKNAIMLAAENELWDLVYILGMNPKSNLCLTDQWGKGLLEYLPAGESYVSKIEGKKKKLSKEMNNPEYVRIQTLRGLIKDRCGEEEKSRLEEVKATAKKLLPFLYKDK